MTTQKNKFKAPAFGIAAGILGFTALTLTPALLTEKKVSYLNQSNEETIEYLNIDLENASFKADITSKSIDGNQLIYFIHCRGYFLKLFDHYTAFGACSRDFESGYSIYVKKAVAYDDGIKIERVDIPYENKLITPPNYYKKAGF